MKTFEVRLASKSVTIFGFLGAILLCGILYYLGIKMKHTTQQTYLIIAVLGIYVLVMYRINLKKSRLVNFYINRDQHIIVQENKHILQDINTITSYYYKNIIPKKFGFLLQVKTEKQNYNYYITSKDLSTYKKSDSDNIDQLSNCLDSVLKGKKNKNLMIDFIVYLPLSLILVSITIISWYIFFY